MIVLLIFFIIADVIIGISLYKSILAKEKIWDEQHNINSNSKDNNTNFNNSNSNNDN